VFAPATWYLTPAEQVGDSKNELSTSGIPAPLGAGIPIYSTHILYKTALNFTINHT